MQSKQVCAGILTFVFVGAFAACCLGAEMIDDPGYTYWSKFKPGAFAVTQTDLDTAGQKMSMQLTTTLLKVTPEKITVEVKTEASMGATKLPPRTTKNEVAAKRAKLPDSSITESREVVTVGDKKYACRLLQETSQGMHIRLWMCEQVPGGMVKMEMTGDASAMKSHLVEFSVKPR